MESSGEEKNVYRRIYKRQNAVFFGVAVMLAAAALVLWVLVMGAKTSAQRREHGYLKAAGDKVELTQSVLDYLGAMSEIRAATALLEFEGSITMGDYLWTGTVWGLAFEGADLRFSYGGGNLEGGSMPPVVFAHRVSEDFVRRDGEKMGEKEKSMLAKKMTEEELAISWGETEMGEGEEPPSDRRTNDRTERVRFGGILKEAGDLLDNSIMIPLQEAARMQRIQGNTGEPRGLLVEVEHIQDAKTVISALQKMGIQAENPYEEVLRQVEEQEKTLRVYFCMAVLLLLFSALYVRSLLREPLAQEKNAAQNW